MTKYVGKPQCANVHDSIVRSVIKAFIPENRYIVELSVSGFLNDLIIVGSEANPSANIEKIIAMFPSPVIFQAIIPINANAP